MSLGIKWVYVCAGKEVGFTQNARVVLHWLPFLLVCLMWFLCWGGDSTADCLGEDEQCVVLVVFVVIVSAAFVLVVGLSRVRCLYVVGWVVVVLWVVLVA